MVFLLSLFFLKTKTEYKNQAVQNVGLVYNDNATLADLVNRDRDKDGVLDWEEGLWETDPHNPDTFGKGLGDKAEIEKIKLATRPLNELGDLAAPNQENLTQTDKFSRELFSTIATLNQTGPIDQATIDKLSSSLSEQIKNASARKIYTISEIKIINDDSVKATQKYNDDIENLYKKYPIKGNAIQVLKESMVDQENIDVSVLSKLDPIIKQTNMIISGMVKMDVPISLSNLHLEIINSLQRLIENLNDIKLFDTDVVVALSAMSQYEKNTNLLQTAVAKLTNAIDKKLSS